jgi:C4-dicarboxylate transporter DctM subunit
LLLTMLNDQYSESFSLGFITTSGGIGLLFAPSVPMILYAIIAGVPVYDFFYSGILPGLFIMLLFYSYSFLCIKKSTDRPEFEYKIEKGKSLPMILEILLPLFVLTAIYSGFLAIPEVAAITLLYVIFVEFMLSKELNLKLMFHCLEESMSLVGSIFIILGVSLASTNYIIDAGIPERIFNSLDFIVNGRVSFLIFLIFFLLIIGAFLDMYAAIIVVLPILIPMAHAYDVPLIHLGIIFITVMEIGFITPPIGINLFISSNRFNKSIFEIYKTTLPFFLLMVFAAMMIAFFPNLFLIRS